MRTSTVQTKPRLPSTHRPWPTYRQLHRHQKLPTVVATTPLGRYLHRLQRLFGGG